MWRGEEAAAASPLPPLSAAVGDVSGERQREREFGCPHEVPILCSFIGTPPPAPPHSGDAADVGARRPAPSAAASPASEVQKIEVSFSPRQKCFTLVTPAALKGLFFFSFPPFFSRVVIIFGAPKIVQPSLSAWGREGGGGRAQKVDIARESLSPHCGKVHYHHHHKPSCCLTSFTSSLFLSGPFTSTCGYRSSNWPKKGFSPLFFFLQMGR